MAGFWPEVIEVDKNKKPKSVEWPKCKLLMGNPQDFVNRLLSYKDRVDNNEVPQSNVNIVKQ